MGRLINGFNFYLYRLKAVYQETNVEPSFKKSLLVLYGHLLRTYDEETHYELRRLYRENIHDLPNNINYAIVYLVLMDVVGAEKIGSIDFEIVREIIAAFIKGRVNPYNFKNYLNLFLDDEIVEMLGYLWCLTSKSLYVYLIGLINTYGPQSTEEYYTKFCVLKYLCELVGIPFSPILKRHFTVSGIKRQLSIELASLSSQSEDYEVLDMLDSLKVSLSKKERTMLIENIRYIETNFGHQKERAIRLMLSRIKDFYDFYIFGSDNTKLGVSNGGRVLVLREYSP